MSGSPRVGRRWRNQTFRRVDQRLREHHRGTLILTASCLVLDDTIRIQPTMPPRKRVKRNGEDSPPTNTPVRSTRRVPDTQRTPATHRNTRAQSVRSTRSDATSTPLPTGRAPSPYRTRHRRSVRGPELAELEGSRDDCVPPSDDEEYDAWRAVRAIERAEQLQLEDDEVRALCLPSYSPTPGDVADPTLV